MDLYWIFLMLLSAVVSIGEGQRSLNAEGRAYQSSTYLDIFVADKALQPPASTNWSTGCSHTKGDSTVAWWKIVFSQSFAITKIMIYYRDNFPWRINGFYLYITNDSTANVDEKPDGYLCYKDPETMINQSFIFDIDCFKLGRSVVFYNRNQTKAFVELCYVEVHGCPLTKHGMDCSLSCPAKCIDQHCFPGNGSCVFGCGSGFCLDNSCHDDGTCTRGCKPENNGQYCNKSYENLALNRIAIQIQPYRLISSIVDGNRLPESCVVLSSSNSSFEIDIGIYGIIKAVYLNIIDTSNNKDKIYSIYCTNVSNSNQILLYQGQLPNQDIDAKNKICRFVRVLPPDNTLKICEVEVIGCQGGWYGKYCNNLCPVHCGGPCDLDKGECIHGCTDGYTGITCDKECKNGQYGSNCLQKCSENCNESPCDHVTGRCANGGCKPGWLGDNCATECSPGKFGSNCSESCVGCVDDFCDNVYGICNNKTACKPGWKWTQKCNEKCDTSYFGENCEQKCDGCIGEICHFQDGICINDTHCKPGYMYEEKCNKKCSPGTYGNNCSDACNGCVDDLCDNVEGFCSITHTCKLGWQRGQRCDEVVDIEDEESDSNVGIGVGAGVSLFLLLVIILGTLIYVKRRRVGVRKESVLKYRKGPKSHSSNIDLRKSKGIYNRGAALSIDLSDSEDEQDMPRDNNECVYNNIVLNEDSNQYKIPLENLMKAIVDKHQTESFKKEYEAMPKGLVFAHDIAKKTENKTKNRFRTTFPYDHSRVILKGDTLHDYINASHIDNYQTKKAYIASQGPKGNTLRDFWHMIWQEKAGKIVMVTRLIEEKGKKCEQYWPESTSEGLTLENYNLSMTKEVEHSIYVYREIKVFNTTTKEERTVKQFHFTQWPDHGVPDKIKLVNFYRKVKAGRTDLPGPMIVHCSAGIGRTGTFIALDALYENGKITGFVDVMDYVKMMRKDRMNMIQTVDQYIVVYEALLELFSVPDTSIPNAGFSEYIEKHFKQTVPKNQTNLRQEFQRLQGLRPVFKDEDFSVGKASENQRKNYVNTILPHNDYRPYLTSCDASGTDYINAIIIPGYSVKSKFIVTQFPLKDTVVDFWTMVYEHGSAIIVLLDSFEKTTALWGDGKRDFKNLRVKKTQDHSEDEIEILLAKQNDARTITVLKTTEWKGDQNALPSPQIIVRLLKRISRHQSSKQGPVVIVCRDGCTRSGLALALGLVKEKMTMDDEVDIFQVVRTMQTRRPEFLSNFNQYEYCYRCIREYLEGDSIYMNVELSK